MKNKQIKIRPAIETDYESINLLFKESYRLYQKVLPEVLKKSPKTIISRGTFLNTLEDKDWQILVAEINNKPVGMIQAGIEEEIGNDFKRPNRRIEIEEICVHKKFNRQGIGRALIAEIENGLKQRG
jgi:ribosomal protein S18 acetylase RimI-like enzyme